MEFEAPKGELHETDDTESALKKRAILGKLAEGGVVELRGENSGSEGEIYLQKQVEESTLRHMAQTFMGERQAAIAAEQKKLNRRADSARVAEVAADALLLEQARVELAGSPLDKPAESSIDTARERTEKLIDKALGVENYKPSLEGAVPPAGYNPDAPFEARPANIKRQITGSEAAVRRRTAEQFEHVEKPAKAAEALQTNTSDYAELVPLYKQELSMTEMRAIGSRIQFEGLSLTQLFETNQFDEEAFRRIIAEFLTGGDVDAAVKAEKEAHEGRFERDPNLRQQQPAQAPAGTDDAAARAIGRTVSKLASSAGKATKVKTKSDKKPKAEKELDRVEREAKSSEFAQTLIEGFKGLELTQLLTVAAVALFMVALIFVALALTG